MSLEKLKRLDELVSQRLLTKSETVDSSGRNLVLYNYTDACTYAKAWTEDTLNARGTIYSKATGELVAATFSKFFNLGENELSQRECFPWDKPWRAFEKVDGSLGTIYSTGDGGWAVATRGSFHSEQAKKATEMLSKYDLSHISACTSLVVEIVYPANRIMVDYKGVEVLVLLAAFNGDRELPWKTVKSLAEITGMGLPKTYDVMGLGELLAVKEYCKWNEWEGWVIRFDDGQRVKIKCTDYLRAAKLKAHMGPLAVWEAMSVGGIEKYLEALPEELREDAESVHRALEGQMDVLLAVVAGASVTLGIPLEGISDVAERKEKAMEIQNFARDRDIQGIQGVLLSLLSGKPVAPMLLKKLRPVGNAYVDVMDVVAGKKLVDVL
jgi:RNA ligase